MTVPGLRRALAALVGNVPESLRVGGLPTDEPAPVFYSALERFVENNPTQRAPISQWRGMIQNAPGIKAEEIEAVTGNFGDKWLRHLAFGNGLDDVGDLGRVERHQITREALLDALRRDRVGLDERVAGGAPGAQTDNNVGEYGRTRAEAEEAIEEDYADEISDEADERARSSFEYDYTSPRDEWEIIPHHPQDPPPRLIPRDTETRDMFSREDGDGVAPWNGYDYDPELPAPEERPLQYWIAQQFRRNNLARNRARTQDASASWASRIQARENDGLYSGRWDRPEEHEYGLPSEDSEFPSSTWSEGMSDSDAYDRYREIVNAPGASGLPYPQRAARLREHAFGPFRTREEAEEALDPLEEAHRRASEDEYLQNGTARDEHWGEVRDEYVNRYLGEDGYEYDDMDGGDVGVKWKSYSMPGNGNGGANYGEMVIRMPKNPLGGDFQSGHWNDENVLSHVRFHDRTHDGKRTLFIEEMQSDWHQKGREGGYIAPAPEAEVRAARDRYFALGDELVTYAERVGALTPGEGPGGVDRHLNAMYALQRMVENGNNDVRAESVRIMRARDVARQELNDLHLGSGVVQNAPFKDNRWAELSMKRMIRWAADHGYDQIAWSGRVKNGDVTRDPGSSLPRGADFYDKVLNNITNGIVKKSGGRVKRVNMGFAKPGGDGDPSIPVEGLGRWEGSAFIYEIADAARTNRPLRFQVEALPEEMRAVVEESSAFMREALDWRGRAGVNAEQPPEMLERSRELSQRLKDTVAKLSGQAQREPVTDANVLELTPQLKQKAQREGFPLYMLPALMGGGAEAIRRMMAEDREGRA